MKKFLIMLICLVSLKGIAQTENNDVFSKMRTVSMGNSVYYYDKSSPTSTDTKAFYIYVVKPSNSNPYIMVRFQYRGSSGISVYGYNLMTDNHTSYNITPPSGMIIRDGNNYDDYRSHCDLTVGEKFLNFLREIIKAEKPKLEYLGRKDNLTVKISNSEVRAISNVLDLYDELKK